MIALADKRILIVDDEPSIRDAYAMSFDLSGAKTAKAGDGYEALDLLRKHSFDAVVADIRMPKMDGIELLEKLKSVNPDTPVVALITGYMDLAVDEAYEKGAEAILTKPVRLEDLEETICRFLCSREERWTPKAGSRPPEIRLERQFPDIAEAMKSGGLRLGRGGMFLSMRDMFPPAKARVSLSLTFVNGESSRLEGEGIVRWTRKDRQDELPTGCGIEFDSLDDSSRMWVIRLIEETRPQAFIPKQ